MDLERFTAWDIETDTRGGQGLDPATSTVVAIGAGRYRWAGGQVQEEATLVATGDEPEILGMADAWLRSEGTGALFGWFSSQFDAPFVQARSRALGIDLGLTVASAPTGAGPHRWHDLIGVDACVEPIVRSWCETMAVSRSLKARARHLGLDPVEVDRSRIHLLSDEELSDYVLSDVRCLAAVVAAGVPLVTLSTEDRRAEHLRWLCV